MTSLIPKTRASGSTLWIQVCFDTSGTMCMTHCVTSSSSRFESMPRACDGRGESVILSVITLSRRIFCDKDFIS